jgi:hypothetical protein
MASIPSEASSARNVFKSFPLKHPKNILEGRSVIGVVEPVLWNQLFHEEAVFGGNRRQIAGA